MKSLEEILANTEVDPATGCRIWLRGRFPSGYGEVYWQGKQYRVHRLVWELTTGHSPGALDVLHTCDNRPCCEFAHLFLGTHGDNNWDCIAKGRKPHGEQAGHHKLTEVQVAEIKKLLVADETQERIAAVYGVWQGTISGIARNVTWKHIPWPAKEANG